MKHSCLSVASNLALLTNLAFVPLTCCLLPCCLYSASIVLLSCSHKNRFAENGHYCCPLSSMHFSSFQPSFILFLLLFVSCLYQSPSRSFGLLGFFCLLILCFFLVFSFSLFFFSCVLAPLSCSFLFLRFFSVGLRRK